MKKKIIKKCLTLLLIFSLSFVSCDNSNLVKWRADKKAKHSFRNVANTEKIIEEYNLKDLNCIEIKKILGEPDKFSNEKGVIYLQYYIETNCEMIKYYDCCSLTICYFKNSSSISITCT